MCKYYYSGYVMVFDKCVASKWTATTWAVSKKKALSNITFQCKKDLNLVASSKIKLDSLALRKIGE